MTKQAGWFVGLVTFICTAILGQAELVGEPWRHYVAVGAIIGTAASGYMLQHPPPPWTGEERRDPEKES